MTVWSWPPIVIVAVRGDPGLAAALNVTTPLPVPVAPAVIVIHVAEGTLVQLQPAGAVTVIGAELPPETGMFCDAGLITNVQAVAWFTVNVWPAIVTVPVRDAPVFAAALTVTVPLPEPELAPLNVSQLAWLVDVHAQPAPAVTSTGVVEAPAPIETELG